MIFKDLRIINKDERVEWEAYYENILPLFDLVSNSSVLEIGPFMGYITEMIKYYKRDQPITLVEPNSNAVMHLRQEYLTYDIQCQDAFHYLETNRAFDVVVCFGVLYHLHSPLYFLELIVNRAMPKILMLETTGANIQHPRMGDEVDNTPGMRYTTGQWRSCKKSMCVPADLIIDSMNNMGYDVMHKQNGRPEYPESKRGTTLIIFKKQNDNNTN